MEILKTPEAVIAWCSACRAGGAELGLVPTMGALHEGHLSLVRRGLLENECALVSVFVNPLQFEEGSDLASYPAPLDEDLDMLRGIGAHAVFVGNAGEIYPPEFQSFVEPRGNALPLEGSARPGHFRGVATIVLKLLLMVRPARAYFGQKDYQQLRVIEALERDLHLGCQIVPCPIIRESDGLAMSSRNRRLTPTERARATCLVRALRAGCDVWESGERVRERLEASIAAVLDATPGIELEYAAVVDASSLEPWSGAGTPRALVAARLGAVRLIDNLSLDAPPHIVEAGS